MVCRYGSSYKMRAKFECLTASCSPSGAINCILVSYWHASKKLKKVSPRASAACSSRAAASFGSMAGSTLMSSDPSVNVILPSAARAAIFASIAAIAASRSLTKAAYVASRLIARRFASATTSTEQTRNSTEKERAATSRAAYKQRSPTPARRR